MSKCMTIDETVDQKDTCTELAPKRIVEFILEEALLLAFVILDKGCSRIGDFNITDDFRSQHDQLSCEKDFEQVEQTQIQSAGNQESNLNSGENADRPSSWLTARGHLESIIDSLAKNEDKVTPASECTVITEEILADNELQIQNGQIHIETNRSEKNITEPELLEKEDGSRNEKIEIEYYNEGKLNKIYVPLNPSTSSNSVGVEEKPEGETDGKDGEDTGRPFKPFTTEEVRQSSLQVWENGISSFVGKWDGDVLAETEDVVRLMDGLSSVQMFPESFSDPNRPRACAFGEEDIRKMIKEIEEISLTQSQGNVKDFDVAFLPDGQGDADLESKSFTKSKDILEKAQKAQKLQEELESKSTEEPRMEEEQLISQSENIVTSRPESKTSLDGKVEISTANVKFPTDNIKGEQHLQYKVMEKESLLNSRLYDEATIKDKISADQILGLAFSIDPPAEKIIKNSTSDSGVLSKEESPKNMSRIFLKDTIHLKGFQSERNLCNEYLSESVSLSGNIGSLGGSKQEELTLKNSGSGFEPDARSDHDKKFDQIKESYKDNSELVQDGNPTSDQSTNNSERVSSLRTKKEGHPSLDSVAEEKRPRIPSVESFVGGEERTESNGDDDFLQEPDTKSGRLESHTNVGIETARDFKRPEEDYSCGEEVTGNHEYTENAVEPFKSGSEVKTELSDGGKSLFGENQTSAHQSTQNLNNSENSNAELERNPSSQTHTISAHSLTENGVLGSFERVPEPGTEKFKLHSPKMYLGTNYQLSGSAPNKFTLTESEEAFIDFAESVIQIIEPPLDSSEEDNSKISFSLMSETPEKKPQSDHESQSESSLEKNPSSEIPTKKVFSGMTTIGPMKNLDYDPRNLTAPEIDYGKMTRITSSRQLAKDMSLLSAEVTTSVSVKIMEEDDSDEATSLNTEEDRLDRTSLVNRDIASLTKVQKVREVMSYQPKPEEDFEDDEVLPRPRLDLKDVESMTDERYKVPDVSIPLLSFEIGDGSLDAGKELIETMGLVISGLTNPAFYDEDEEDSTEMPISSPPNETDSIRLMKPSEVKLIDSKTSTKTITKEPRESKEEKKMAITAEDTQEDPMITAEGPQREGPSNPTKYSTLGSVFRKASSKLIRKDEDLFTRSSKSLPRDPSKMNATDSIKSILDDCQSSASKMLKKSRSLLKNTQSIFKSISQSRVMPDRSSGHSVDQKKLYPSESDVSTIEKKFSGFLRREDFTKAKNLIQSKIEKTFKHDPEGPASVREPEISAERKKKLQVVVKDEQNMRVDKVENFKKLLPKSPLVYKSQFVKSQMNFQADVPEPNKVAVGHAGLGSPLRPVNPLDTPVKKKSKEMAISPIVENSGNESSVDNTESQLEAEERESSKEIIQWRRSSEEFHSIANLEPEPKQPNYIVMETIQGLPVSDLESSSSEKENLNVENKENIQSEKAGNDLKKLEASDSVQIFTDGIHDVAPCFPEIDDEKMLTKTSSERKIKAKKKKFTARFRSFWCSAFGRVKTPPKKADLS